MEANVFGRREKVVWPQLNAEQRGRISLPDTLTREGEREDSRKKRSSKEEKVNNCLERTIS